MSFRLDGFTKQTDAQAERGVPTSLFARVIAQEGRKNDAIARVRDLPQYAAVEESRKNFEQLRGFALSALESLKTNPDVQSGEYSSITPARLENLAAALKAAKPEKGMDLLLDSFSLFEDGLKPGERQKFKEAQTVADAYTKAALESVNRFYSERGFATNDPRGQFNNPNYSKLVSRELLGLYYNAMKTGDVIDGTTLTGKDGYLADTDKPFKNAYFAISDILEKLGLGHYLG